MPVVRATAYYQPVTPLARTVVDLAQTLNGSQLTAVLLDVTRREILTLDQIAGAADGLNTRPGVALLYECLEAFDPEFGSVLEMEADRHFQAAGFQFTKQLEIMEGWLLVAVPDFADEQRRIAIFIDGWNPHSTRTALTRDRGVDRVLRRLGWEPIRFTTGNVRGNPRAMVRDIVALMDLIDHGPHEPEMRTA